jgi:hypothetical protein
MMTTKEHLIYDTKLTISQKHMIMCYANHVLTLKKQYKYPSKDMERKIHVSWLQHEFNQLLAQRAVPGAIQAEFSRHLKQCQAKGLFENFYARTVTFKEEHFDFAVRLEEKFTAQDYEACSLKNVAAAPVPKMAEQLPTKETPTSTKTPFWKSKPNEALEEEKKADVYMMSVNILEKLQPMLLNLIYEELSKEVNHAP